MNLPTDVATQRRNHALLEAELHRLISDTTPLDDDFAMTSVESLSFSQPDLSHPFLRPCLLPLSTSLPSLDDYIEDEFLSCQVNHDGDRVANMSCFMPWNVTPSPHSMTQSSSPTSSSSSTTYSSKTGLPSSAFVPSTSQHAAISAAAATAARILKNQKTPSSHPDSAEHPVMLTFCPSRTAEPKRPRSPSHRLEPFDTTCAPGSPVSSADQHQSIASGRGKVRNIEYGDNGHVNEGDCEYENDLECDLSDDEHVSDIIHDLPNGSDITYMPIPPACMNTPGDENGLSMACLSTSETRVQLEIEPLENVSCKLALPKSCAVPEVESQGPTSPRSHSNKIRGIKGASKDEELSSVRQRRAEAMERFRKKKAMRRYGRRVRYQIRKRIATTRPRVNGRFARRSDIGAVIAISSPTSVSGCDLNTAHASTSYENFTGIKATL